MLEGIVSYQRSHKQWLTFLDDEARGLKDMDWLSSGKWDGIICRHTTLKMAERCRKLGVPLVDLEDSNPIPGVPKIRPDNVTIGHRGAEHFLDSGFRHCGFCGFRNQTWSYERQAGFVDALQLAGRNCFVHNLEFPGVITPEWDRAVTLEISEWLKQLPKPVAVMACVDVHAFQIIHAAQQAGLNVPEDVAVLGVNNDMLRCELSYPPLSSVEPNAFKAGYLAAETLARLINGDRKIPPDVRIEPLDVVMRHSSNLLAIRDPNMVAALRCIHQYACSGLTVQQIERASSMSRSVLEKKFRHYLGRSPQAEIRRVQIAKVRTLLRDTDAPLKQIAEQCSFSHVEYLSVVFKRITGQTPGHYRTSAREGRVNPSKS
jgi:LacI family transcriptional regulator